MSINRFIFLLIFFYSCTSLQKIDKIKIANLQEFETLEDENFLFQEIQLEGLEINNQNFVKDLQKLAFFINGITVSDSLRKNQILEPFLKYFDYIRNAISKKNPEIIFSDNESLATHFLYIELVSTEVNRFKIIAKVIRKDNPKIQYNREVGYLEILSTKDNDKVLLKKNQNVIEMIKPTNNEFLYFSNDFESSLVNLFNQIGKGSFHLVTVEPNDFIIQRGTEEIIKGKTPQKLSLLEGNYLLIIQKKGFQSKKIPFTIKEGEENKILFRWDDENLSTSLYLDSNRNYIVRFDGEIKGNNPIVLSELAKGFYQIEYLKEDKDEYVPIFKRDILLKQQVSLRLFYPEKFYQSFSGDDFYQSSKKNYWYIGKQQPVIESHQLNSEFLSLKKRQKFFTPHYLLDNMRGEFLLSCNDCNVYFLFDNDEKFYIKKQKELFISYYGKDPLKLENIYSLNEKELYFYFEYDNSAEEFSVYLNTNVILEKRSPFRHVQIVFENLSSEDKDFRLYQFYLSSDERKNPFMRSFFFIRKNLNKMFQKSYFIEGQ